MSGNDWDWENDWNESPPVPKDWDMYYCNHEWQATMLIFTTVYDCKKCNKKKEECE